MIAELLKSDDCIVEAIGVTRNGEVLDFSAKAVVLADGGANRLYPFVADGIQEDKYRTTGDSFALAFAVNAPLRDMEFAQFRDSPPAAPIYGGKYINALGERFMERYDPIGLEKAPRNVMVGAIYKEMIEGRGPIKWDVADSNIEELKVPLGREFASKGAAEITLQFQRLVGGARINEKAETQIKGLFAAGESAGGRS
jgi:succinate dehydrogenase/fumarate reductase flavoprotein subunit